MWMPPFFFAGKAGDGRANGRDHQADQLSLLLRDLQQAVLHRAGIRGAQQLVRPPPQEGSSWRTLVMLQGNCPSSLVMLQGNCPSSLVTLQGNCPSSLVILQGNCPFLPCDVTREPPFLPCDCTRDQRRFPAVATGARFQTTTVLRRVACSLLASFLFVATFKMSRP